MTNIFSDLEEEILFNENLMYDEEKIKEFIFSEVAKRLESKEEARRPFLFEDMIYDFFDYMDIKLVRTKKTRDFGIDGVISMKLNILGEIELGLQIKYKLIESRDIDVFLTALKRAELNLGVLVCKDSRHVQNHKLDSKIKAILLSRGVKLKERFIEENVNINPVFVLRFDEVVNILATRIRSVVKSIYKT